MFFFLLKFTFIFFLILFSINFLDSTLMDSLKFNNQKHLKIIDFIKKKLFYLFFFFLLCVNKFL